jgi:glutamyl-tRNA synthetase
MMPHCCMKCEAYLAAAGRPPLTEVQRDRWRGLPSLKDRAKTFPELLEKASLPDGSGPSAR